ncbi:MAG: hypothetical protein ACI8XM_003111 [Haloarculaceae archaeon]|jgi:hypothetical protein
MHVTKRDLAESYITGTGTILAIILLGRMVLEGPEGLLWAGVGSLPIVSLVGTAYWANQLNLEGDQIWEIAMYSAAALGLAATALLVLDVTTQVLTFAGADTFLIATCLATTTAVGALAGFVRELQRTNQRLGLRNTVLHRVLRHNLRNDMTVLLCLLDELETTAEEDQQELIDQSRRRIRGLVNLTDKVRQVNVTVNQQMATTTTVDLVSLVEDRLERLKKEYPSLTVETDLPDSALVTATEQFGLVLDNVVQSAVTSGENPVFEITVRTTPKTVQLCLEDQSDSIPDADLTALATQDETELEHGLGVELWLVYWLVESSDGDIRIERADGIRRIEVTLDRATKGLVPEGL